ARTTRGGAGGEGGPARRTAADENARLPHGTGARGRVAYRDLPDCNADRHYRFDVRGTGGWTPRGAAAGIGVAPGEVYSAHRARLSPAWPHTGSEPRGSLHPFRSTTKQSVPPCGRAC